MVLFHELVAEGCWITERVEFMKTERFPYDLPHNKRRFYMLQNNGYQLVEGILFKRNYDRVLLHCVNKQQAKRILHEFHNGLVRGHFLAQTTAIKVTHARYYWPSLFNDSHSLVRECKECQLYVGKHRNATMPLRPIVVDEMGIEFYRNDQPDIYCRSQMDSHCNKLFHQVDRGTPLKKYNGNKDVKLLREPCVKVWPTKNHHFR